jgi:glycosyltransferase involved in cell wall biosynthesis
LLNQLYKNGALCFAISFKLVEYLSSICKDRTPVIHLPISVDVDFINLFKKNRSLNVAQQSIKIFYGGSFGFKDGFEYLIKGFELACESNNNIELILTGKVSKQMMDKVQLLIFSSKRHQQIKFLGCLSDTDYYDTMVNSDILCMTRTNSKYSNFGFPFKLGEYLVLCHG